MRLSDARQMAVDLTNRHAMKRVREGWSFGGFDRAKKRAGICRYDRKTWHLSESFTLLNSDADVRETALHEIAHVLNGPGFGHGPVWRAQARRIGATGKATYSASAVIMPDTPLWWGICQKNSEHRVGRHRRPAERILRYGRCPRCSHVSLRWLNTRNGAVVFYEGARRVDMAGGAGA